MKRNRLNRGFTLIEMMMVVLLTAFLMLSVSNLFIIMLKGQGKTKALALVKQEADASTVALERIIRSGYKATCDLDNKTVIINQKLDTGLIRSTMIFVDVGEEKLKVNEQQQSTAITTAAGFNPGTIRELTGASVIVDPDSVAVLCKITGDYSRQMVLFEYSIADENHNDLVLFRVISTLRNVSN